MAKFRPIDAPAVSTVTEAGIVVGTFGYMAPEQLLGNTVDHHADIFALGVILVELLTGRRPFRGDTYQDLLRSVLNDVYHLPTFAPEAVPLDHALQRCLAKEPSARLTSALGMRDELLPLLRVCPPFPYAGSANQSYTTTA